MEAIGDESATMTMIDGIEEMMNVNTVVGDPVGAPCPHLAAEETKKSVTAGEIHEMVSGMSRLPILTFPDKRAASTRSSKRTRSSTIANRRSSIYRRSQAIRPSYKGINNGSKSESC